MDSFIFGSKPGSVIIVDNSVLKSWNFSADLATPFDVFDNSVSQKRRPSIVSECFVNAAMEDSKVSL